MKKILVVFILLIMCSSVAEARVKLVALPERENVIIRLDNPSFTLIEEERILTLQKGLNQVDFSWKGVRIDTDSIRIKMLSHPEKVKLLNVSYPPNENALVWQISSPEALEEKIRISYLLSGIDCLSCYKAIANKGENLIDIKSFLILRNFSGENFHLANIAPDDGKIFQKSIQYEETMQLLFFEKKKVPIKKTLTFDAGKLPWEPQQMRKNVGIPVHYVIKNNKASNLGNFALQNGKVRVFQGNIFLGEDKIKFTPVDEKAELYIGDSRNIVVTQHKMKEKMINIRRNSHNQIILYDTDEAIRAEIENFKDKDTVLILIEHIPGQWDMKKSSHKFEEEDAHTIKFYISIPAHEKEIVTFNYHRRNIR